MPLVSDIKNALSFLCRGEFQEFFFRLRAHFGALDLRYASVGELGLSPERSHDYRHSGGIHLEKVLDTLQIGAEDAIVDFGAGKGGALITFAKYPFARITGIELKPELAEIARSNFRLLKLTNIGMVVGDAADFSELDAYNYFYFYSPFPEEVMATVMRNIAASLAKAPRAATLIYCNPEFHETVIEQSPFHKSGEFLHRQLSLPIFLYRYRP
jgi:SAM-dependent methyltransferase